MAGLADELGRRREGYGGLQRRLDLFDAERRLLHEARGRGQLARIVALLQLPYLKLFSGVLLLWLAFDLLRQDEDEKNVKATGSIWGAVRTIALADAITAVAFEPGGRRLWLNSNAPMSNAGREALRRACDERPGLHRDFLLT